MGNMTIMDFILYATLIFFVLYVTRQNNMWGVGKGTKKAKEDARIEKNLQKKRLFYIRLMDRLVWVANNLGFEPKPNKVKTLKYQLERLEWKVPVLGRVITPYELLGLLKCLTIIMSFIGVLGLVLTQSPFFLLFFVSVLSTSIFSIYAESVIASEDAELEEDFPDFFLVMYNRLLKGTNMRIAPTLDEYMRTLDVMHGGTCNTVLKRFIRDLRNNIEIYGDDGIAVMRLREKYHSVMVINFCNLAVQSINGVDNADKLLSFKMELNNRKVEQMKKRADKLVQKGRRAVLVIYVILFQFVLLSWIAKLSLTGGIKSILGF